MAEGHQGAHGRDGFLLHVNAMEVFYLISDHAEHEHFVPTWPGEISEAKPFIFPAAKHIYLHFFPPVLQQLSSKERQLPIGNLQAQTNLL